MAKVIKRWKLTNENSSKSFSSIEEFFNHSSSIVVDTATLDRHVENDDTYCTGKLGFLGEDKKHVIIVREFGSEDMADKWKTIREDLGDIDNLITEVEEEVLMNEAYDFNVENEVSE
jgi:hypothetical protein